MISPNFGSLVLCDNNAIVHSTGTKKNVPVLLNFFESMGLCD